LDRCAQTNSGAVAVVTDIMEECSRKSMPVRWAWLDLNQRPHPDRKMTTCGQMAASPGR
jgi:hypothetical protein